MNRTRNPASRFDNLRWGSLARLVFYKGKAKDRAESPGIMPHYAAEYRAPDGWKRTRWVTPHGLGFNAPGEECTRSTLYGSAVINMDSKALDHLRQPDRDKMPRDYREGPGREPRGWYCDSDCSQTVGGRVAVLPSGPDGARFLGFIAWSDCDGISVLSEVFDDAGDAWTAADSLAERVAEEEREHNEKWQAASDLDSEREEARDTLKAARQTARDCVAAVRMQKELGAIASKACEVLRARFEEAREEMREALADIERCRDGIADLDMTGDF